MVILPCPFLSFLISILRFKFIKQELTWTASNTDLVEGLFALVEIGAINNGNVDMSKIVEVCKNNFGIDLGEDRLISAGTALCPTQTLSLNATQSSAIGYQWFENNISLIGESKENTIITYDDYFNKRQLREKSKDELFFIFVNDIWFIDTC